jgi:UMF1 family MFS transporter
MPDTSSSAVSVRAPRGAVAWAFYDLANTIYSMNVITLFFAQWVTVDRGRQDLWYSLFYGGSMAMVALTLPYLGLWSDRGGRRLLFLGIFTAVSVGATATLGWVTNLPGTAGVLIALSVFALSNYAFQGGLVFYNALLPAVSLPETRGRVSGFGVALGYLGSFVGMLLVTPFVEGKMPLLGLTVPGVHAGGRTAAFLPTAILFGLFALPIFLRVHEQRGPVGPGPSWREALREIRATLADSRRYPGVLVFLAANILILDAVQTVIIFMAVYAQKVLGMPDSAKVVFFMLATIPAIAGSFLAGWVADRIGARRTLIGTAWLWAACLLAVALVPSDAVFYAIGGVVGALLGSLWTASRPLLLTLTPPGEEGRLFGLYAFTNKASAVVGPLLWGLVVLAAEGLGNGRYRLAVGILSIMVVTGAVLLQRVPDLRARRATG